MTTAGNAELVRTSAERVNRWLEGGCSSWGTPADDIKKLVAAALEATASPVVTDAGLRAAIKFIEKRRDDYVAEHGIYDPETGACELEEETEGVCPWEESQDEPDPDYLRDMREDRS